MRTNSALLILNLFVQALTKWKAEKPTTPSGGPSRCVNSLDLISHNEAEDLGTDPFRPDIVISCVPVLVVLSSQRLLTITWCNFCAAFQDSAEWYENEAQCGRAILDFCKASGTPREEIYYTTKLKENRGFAHAKASAKKSLDKCDLGYIDLYLIHSPIGGPQRRAENWKALIEAKKEGLVRSIGVSNYGLRHLQEMVDSGLELPAVNQVRLLPPSSPTEFGEGRR